VDERKKEHMAMYYVSHALTGVELNYLLIEKFAYALILAIKQLCPYFEGHKITVLMEQPSKGVMQKLNSYRRLLKWVVDCVNMISSTKFIRAIKSQALANFFVEMASKGKPVE